MPSNEHILFRDAFLCPNAQSRESSKSIWLRPVQSLTLCQAMSILTRILARIAGMDGTFFAFAISSFPTDVSPVASSLPKPLPTLYRECDMVDTVRARFPGDMTRASEFPAMGNLEHVANDLLDRLKSYARDEPVSFGLWAVGIGFVLGWKLKPW